MFAVETNPIHKVDVIYSHDVNSVKLQWMLEPHIQVENVAGYDVYLSQDKVRLIYMQIRGVVCWWGLKEREMKALVGTDLQTNVAVANP